MSHTPPTLSPAGTPLLDRTVGELVAERPGRSRIFQTNKIEFCCQGKKTLREACERKGVSPKSIVEALEQEAADKTEPENNPAELPIRELCEYIVQKHHGFLREELPRIHAMAERVAHVHGSHTPSLVEIYKVFTDMANELAGHVEKEEGILFPGIEAMSRGESVPGSLEGPVEELTREHAKANNALARLRELTHDYQPPADACNTYRALFAGLEDLETDLQRHIHLENSVLFPAALKMF